MWVSKAGPGPVVSDMVRYCASGYTLVLAVHPGQGGLYLPARGSVDYQGCCRDAHQLADVRPVQLELSRCL